MSLTIRRASVRDAAAYARIMADPQVYPGLLQMPYGDEETWQARLAETLKPGSADLALVAERSGQVVATAGLHPVGPSPRRRHAMTLGLAVAPAAQRQGVGRALMDALTDYADRWTQVLRLELTVFADNAAAITLYRRCGFAVEGTLRAYARRDGDWVDALAMARLHPDLGAARMPAMPESKERSP